jgi:7-cyano-7-deazaguanine reductase
MSSKEGNTAENPLGKPSAVSETLDPGVLFFIDRSTSEVRKDPRFLKLKISGEDIWNCYEFAWLNKYKIPQMGICRIRYDSNSTFIVESKSLKLYLSSFYNTVCLSPSHAEETIYKDLDKKLLSSKLSISVIPIEEEERYAIITSTSQAFCLDNLDSTKPELEISGEGVTEDYVCTNSFRSICPVTSQPDWATIEIHYKGTALDRKSLLGYLISFRNHAAFHEEVCEKIYFDIYNLITPEFLFVRCNFLRRGGIDINPVRYSSKYNYNPLPTRLLRQ